MDEKKLIILVQGHERLYNLQHKDYDNNLVKDNSWKEIAGELNVQDKELSQRTPHCLRMAGSWQGNGMVCVNRSLLCAHDVARTAYCSASSVRRLRSSCATGP
jgi:hypothetical protein